MAKNNRALPSKISHLNKNKISKKALCFYVIDDSAS